MNIRSGRPLDPERGELGEWAQQLVSTGLGLYTTNVEALW
jgi:hypothetical protein